MIFYNLLEIQLSDFLFVSARGSGPNLFSPCVHFHNNNHINIQIFIIGNSSNKTNHQDLFIPWNLFTEAISHKAINGAYKKYK